MTTIGYNREGAEILTMVGNQTIVILDYGMGNVGSIQNMLWRIGARSVITHDPCKIKQASKLILPGVGAFDHAMARLHELSLIPLLNELVLECAIPVFGICLGMQLFSKRSEEGKLPGLGWIDAETVKFSFDGHSSTLKVPHMGWNTAQVRKKGIMENLPPEPRFYFVHSYHVRCASWDDVMATTEYGITFHSALHRGNIYGTQFHPEKSHKYGKALLSNFAAVVA